MQSSLSTGQPGAVQVSSSSSPAGAYSRPDVDNDDSEWEYEYVEADTEDFYFTLDLTTHVPDAISSKEYSANGKRRQKGQPRPPVTADAQPGRQNGATAAAGASASDGSAAQPRAGELQVLDLHTSNPLIKFDGRVYSCYWMTDLGTQIYVARPGATARPLRSGHVLDVLGASQARLVGRPVTLVEREPSGASGGLSQEGASSSSAIRVDDDDDDGMVDDETASTEPPTGTVSSAHGPPQPLVIPKDRLTTPQSRRQASFLERLSAVKIRKGEYDRVPMFSVRNYDPDLVENKDQIKAAAGAADAAKGGKSPAEGQVQPRDVRAPSASKSGRKRKADLMVAELDEVGDRSAEGGRQELEPDPEAGLQARHAERETSDVPTHQNGTTAVDAARNGGASQPRPASAADPISSTTSNGDGSTSDAPAPTDHASDLLPEEANTPNGRPLALERG